MLDYKITKLLYQKIILNIEIISLLYHINIVWITKLLICKIKYNKWMKGNVWLCMRKWTCLIDMYKKLLIWNSNINKLKPYHI